MFATNQTGEAFTTSTVPMLQKAEIKIDCLDDGKDYSTLLHVFVKNRLKNSLSPEQNSDFISNQLVLQAYRDPANVNEAGQNPLHKAMEDSAHDRDRFRSFGRGFPILRRHRRPSLQRQRRVWQT